MTHENAAQERISRFGNPADGTPVERRLRDKLADTFERLRDELDDERAKYDRLWSAFQLLIIEIDTLHSEIAAIEASSYVLAAGGEVQRPPPSARRLTSGGDGGAVQGEDVGGTRTPLTFPAGQE